MHDHTDTDLTHRLDTIESLTGNGTELVSITHPPEKSLNSLQTRIRREYAQAENIQADTTRKHVQQALDKALRITHKYTHTPENGIGIFTGVIDGDLRTHVFDSTTLTEPIQTSQYTCDAEFNTTPIREITTPDTTYGLLVIERGAAIIGELRGEQIITHHEQDSHVMGKTRAGGQSAQRFARDRERQLNEFFQTTAETLTQQFIKNNQCCIDGLLIGGTLGTAKQFTSNTELDHRLRDAILNVCSVDYATKRGLEQLVAANQSVLKESRHSHAFDKLDEFLSRLATTDPVTYSETHVERACTYGAIDTLLLTSQNKNEHTDLIQRVKDQGGEIVTVPTTTEDGTAFQHSFGGIGALLRFKIN